jgi:hypothetical protein
MSPQATNNRQPTTKQTEAANGLAGEENANYQSGRFQD